MPKELVQLAKQAAETDNRSLSNYILTLIADDIALRETAAVKLAEQSAIYKAKPVKSKQRRTGT